METLIEPSVACLTAAVSGNSCKEKKYMALNWFMRHFRTLEEMQKMLRHQEVFCISGLVLRANVMDQKQTYYAKV